MRFVALQKTVRSVTQNLVTMPVEDKRSQIVQNVPRSHNSDRLQRIGLVKVEPEDPAADWENTFRRLGYLGAYVVAAQDEAVAEQAIAVLSEEYVILPDLQLGLPQPQLVERFGRRPYRDVYWPAISGVSLARERGITGQGVLVGVLDTGVDADHLELRRKQIDFRYVPFNTRAHRLRQCSGFDVDGHGTHVCGIIAGKNVGIAPDVDLMVASVIESETLNTSLERIVVALDWMLSQFQREENLRKPTIINMSLGFLRRWVSGGQAEVIMNGIRTMIATLVLDFDVLPIVAIGNDGPGVMRAPGFFPETLSVGAVNFDLDPAPFSGGGISPDSGLPEPNLVGFGVDVLSALERGVDRRSLYANMSGTSMATPYVTGIAALCASADSSLVGNALRQHLLRNALPLQWPANRVGAGLARFV